MNANLDIIKFFNRFEDVVEQKRYNELKCEYESCFKVPRLKNQYSHILQQMSKLYTPAVFELFQQEYELFEACSLTSMTIQTAAVDCVITMEKDLSFDLDNNSISCTCRKFENVGILCCHCLRVFIHHNVKSVPERYILKRWTKLARSENLSNVDVSHVVEDVDLSPTQRYKEICPLLIRIATEACKSPETFTFLMKVADELNMKIIEFQNNHVSIDELNGFLGKVKEIEVKGFKKKEGGKGRKRKKSWVEKQLPKRNKNGGTGASQSQEPAVV
jgi:zinc finger SWIM domain-containing protein 3